MFFYHFPFWCFSYNYGMCKPKEERDETLERRETAWKLGLSKGYGTHYKPCKAKNWLWDKSALLDSG